MRQLGLDRSERWGRLGRVPGALTPREYEWTLSLLDMVVSSTRSGYIDVGTTMSDEPLRGFLRAERYLPVFRADL